MKDIDNKRVKQVIKRLVADGLVENQKDLASKLGYTEASLSHLMSGYRPINDKFLGKLLSIAPNLNTEWLKSGEGEMFTNVNGNGNIVQAGIGNNMQNTDCAEQLKMALNEISEQRKFYATHIDRLLSIIEKQNK
ncbi:MAG: helix-turn-helix transcriptional regulator [Clostridiales bacterium]|nr:helix-turn-helix transcriptional regulator [Clostridiales bacterium]